MYKYTGNFEFNLPYGSYTVKQLTSTSGHEKMKDFNIEVKEVGGVIKKVISNAEITAKLRVVKIDAETKEVIKRAGLVKDLDAKADEIQKARDDKRNARQHKYSV